MRHAKQNRLDDERREHVRVKLDGAVRCVLEVGGARHEFVLDDASLGGLRLRTRDTSLFERMDIGSQALIRSVSGNGTTLATSIRATIVWVADLEEKVLAGLSLSPNDAADLFLTLPYDLKEV